jgi:hypothetical protein
MVGIIISAVPNVYKTLRFPLFLYEIVNLPRFAIGSIDEESNLATLLVDANGGIIVV